MAKLFIPKVDGVYRLQNDINITMRYCSPRVTFLNRVIGQKPRKLYSSSDNNFIAFYPLKGSAPSRQSIYDANNSTLSSHEFLQLKQHSIKVNHELKSKNVRISFDSYPSIYQNIYVSFTLPAGSLLAFIQFTTGSYGRDYPSSAAADILLHLPDGLSVGSLKKTDRYRPKFNLWLDREVTGDMDLELVHDENIRNIFFVDEQPQFIFLRDNVIRRLDNKNTFKLPEEGEEISHARYTPRGTLYKTGKKRIYSTKKHWGYTNLGRVLASLTVWPRNSLNHPDHATEDDYWTVDKKSLNKFYELECPCLADVHDIKIIRNIKYSIEI